MTQPTSTNITLGLTLSPAALDVLCGVWRGGYGDRLLSLGDDAWEILMGGELVELGTTHITLTADGQAVAAIADAIRDGTGRRALSWPGY